MINKKVMYLRVDYDLYKKLVLLKIVEKKKYTDIMRETLQNYIEKFDVEKLKEELLK